MEDPSPAFVWLTRIALGLSAAIMIARVTIVETNVSPFDLVSPIDINIDPPRSAGPAEGLVLDLLACLPAVLVLARRAFDSSFRLRLSWSQLPMGLLALWAFMSPLWASNKFAAAVSASHWSASLVMLWAVSQCVRRWVHFRVVASLSLGVLLALASHSLYYKFVDAPDLRANLAKMQAENTATTQQSDFAKRQFEIRVKSEDLAAYSVSTNTFGAQLLVLAMVLAGIVTQFPPEGSNSKSTFVMHLGLLLSVLVALALAHKAIPLFHSLRAVQVLLSILFVALLAMLLFVPAIARILHLESGSRWSWASSSNLALILALAMGVALAVALIPFTESRTALATTMLGGVTMSVASLFRGTLHRYSRVAYTIVLLAIAFTVTAVIHYGVTHGKLFHESLTFRWHYWDGAWRVFKQHWLRGIGWDNFSQFYVGQRTLDATEEPRDPHNFIVRFFTELGVVGGVLALAWLLRLARELTMPRLLSEDMDPAKDRQPPTPSAITILALISAVGIVISIFASIDLSTDPSFIFMELLGRLGILCVLVVGSSFAALRSVREGDADDQPAPWILYGTVIALGLLLVHNTIDFSLFENGTLYLFALLAGAALGVRLGGADANETVPSNSRLAARILLTLSVVSWLIAAGAFVGQVAVAESSAATADRQLRHGDALQAANGYAAALRSVPYNADYAYRASQALYKSGREFRPMIDRAVSLDPVSAKYVLNRARMNVGRMPRSPADNDRIRADFDTATSLDPQNSDMWLDAAAGYEAIGDKAGALERYRHALDMNSRLDPLENDRLTEARVAEVKAKITELERR